MQYLKQFHEQFDRIFNLIQKSTPQQFSFTFDNVENIMDYSLIQDQWKFYDIFEKINILAPIFTAKDEKGEWVLKQGNLPNQNIQHLQNKIKNIEKWFELRNLSDYDFDIFLSKKSIKKEIPGYNTPVYRPTNESAYLLEVRNAPKEEAEMLFYEKLQDEKVVEISPKTLRDLFLANCIPSNDPEQDKIKIENLKLINW